MRGLRFTRGRLVLGVVLTLAAALSLGVAIARSGVPGTYTVNALSSNVPGAATHTDPDLQNGWGIAAPPTGPWWVADNGTDKSTLYDGTGAKLGIIVNILDGAPTGTESRGILKLGARYTQGPMRLDAGLSFGTTTLDPTIALTAGVTYVFSAFTVP